MDKTKYNPDNYLIKIAEEDTNRIEVTYLVEKTVLKIISEIRSKDLYAHN